MKRSTSNQFNKFTFALLQIIGKWTEGEKEITVHTKIKELYDDNFDDFIWMLCLIEIEFLYGIEIPDEFIENKNMSILEFSLKLNMLSIITDDYIEFYSTKTDFLRDRILTYMAEFDIEDGDCLGLGLVDIWVNYIKERD